MFCNLYDCVAYVLLIQPYGWQNSIIMIWWFDVILLLSFVFSVSIYQCDSNSNSIFVMVTWPLVGILRGLYLPSIWSHTLQTSSMGGAAGTAGTAVAVPLSREVRQNKILPYHIIVKNLKHIGDLILSISLNLTDQSLNSVEWLVVDLFSHHTWQKRQM